MNKNRRIQNDSKQASRREAESSNLLEFLSLLDLYSAVYEKLEKERPVTKSRAIRNDVHQPWTKSDLEEILRRRGMERLIPRIRGGAPDEEQLPNEALHIEDEDARLEALCKIPGIGPALASIILAFIYPEDYAILNYHTWNALNYLGFDLPKKGNNGDFKVSELSRYLGIIRKLAKKTNTTPSQIGKALHALNRVNTAKRWRNAFESMLIETARPRGPPNSARSPTRVPSKSVLRPLQS